MRRQVRSIHFARRRLGPLLLALKSSPAEEWPKHFGMARRLLWNELGRTEGEALTIVTASVTAAHACARAINRRSVDLAEFKARDELGVAFARIAKCAKRAPAKLRRRLNESIIPLIRENPIDLEVIDAIFDAAAAAFRGFPEEEAGKTALRLMCGMPPDHDRIVLIKGDYSVLSNTYQREAENAIGLIAKAANDKANVSDVFNALARALDSAESQELNAEAHTQIVEYVAAIARLWHAAGLRPARARHPRNRKYKSKFHRFVDLVLTAMIEPWARRHDDNLDEVGRKIRKAYAVIPQELRSAIRPGLHRSDTEWLVSEDHVKKALRLAAQKNDPDTP